MNISQEVTELCGVQECFGKKMEKINQRGITWKLNTEKKIILKATNRFYLLHIPIKLHENISNDYGVMGCTRMKRISSDKAGYFPK